MKVSHFSGEYENQGSPGSPLLGGTIGPAEEDSHGPCTPEPPPDPQTPGRPAGAARLRENKTTLIRETRDIIRE